jgi:hypothetical protein
MGGRVQPGAMSGIRTLRTGSLVAMATLSCVVVAVAGCGSTDAASGTVTDADSPTASGPNSALQFAKCMRANGVTNFPDPTGGSGAVQIQGTGLNPQSPAFQAAQRACQKYLPSQGQPQVMSDANRKKAVAFAECMRTHGEPDFPDPLLSAPSPSALVFSLRGMLFAPGPGLNPGSPAFRQAATDCGVKLPQPGSKSTAP